MNFFSFSVCFFSLCYSFFCFTKNPEQKHKTFSIILYVNLSFLTRNNDQMKLNHQGLGFVHITNPKYDH